MATAHTSQPTARATRGDANQPRSMSRAEREAFLARGIVCRLGCLDADGYPYVVPVWFEYADGGFYLVPRARSAWAQFLIGDPRVSLCIDAEDSQRVLVKGRARLVEEPNVGGRWVAIAQSMGRRYMGERAGDYLGKTAREPRWVFFVEPERITTWKGGWAERYKHSAW